MVWLFDHSNDSYHSIIVLDFHKILEHPRINCRCQAHILFSKLLAPLSSLIILDKRVPFLTKPTQGATKKCSNHWFVKSWNVNTQYQILMSFTITRDGFHGNLVQCVSTRRCYKSNILRLLYIMLISCRGAKSCTSNFWTPDGLQKVHFWYKVG